MDVLVAGGSGFVGRHLCRTLADRGHSVTAASRSPDPGVLPAGVDTVAMDVTRPDLTDAVAGHDAVVNLVALPTHVSPRRSHRRVHRGGTAHLVAAAEGTGVGRFVQLSALGVDSDVETAYLRAKREAEGIVRGSDLGWAIVRPSIVFGEGCAFLPFLRRVAAPGVVALPGGGRMRIQPVWIGDLAPMLADCVDDDAHRGAVYRVGGPERLTLAETVRLVREGTVVVPLPGPLAAAGLAVAERLPGVPFDRDQYRSFELDNTVDNDDLAAFGVDPDSMLTLERYLSGR